MRIILGSAGGRNEVFPMYALAAEMRRRGHTVTVCVPERYRSKIMQLEHRMVTCGADFREYLEGSLALDGSGFVRALAAEVPAQFVAMRDALLEADVLVCSGYMLAGASVAEQRGIPVFTMIQNPVFLKPENHPASCVPMKAGLLGSPRRKLRREWDEMITDTVNRERGYSGLKPAPDLYRYLYRAGHLLLAISPETAELQAGAAETITGFWCYEEDHSPALQSFVSAGNAPVLVERLPLPQEESAALLRDLCESLAARGLRVVVSDQWPAVQGSALPAGCEIHEVLSMRGFAAVIHSGMPHTFSSAARAGVPQVCVPATVEHAWWAERAQVLGLAPAPIWKATPALVANAVKDALLLKDRCSEMSSRLRNQNGPAVAADTLERFAEQAGHGS